MPTARRPAPGCAEERQRGLQHHDDHQASTGPIWNSVDRANAPPLTLLVANQPTPPAVTDINTAGTTLPLNPNATGPAPSAAHRAAGPARTGSSARQRRARCRARSRRRLPERHAVVGDREDADEDGGELQVGRGPRPEQLAGFTVPVRFCDELVPAGFDGCDLVSVGPVGGGFGRCHDRYFLISHRGAQCGSAGYLPGGAPVESSMNIEDRDRIRTSAPSRTRVTPSGSA